MSPEETMRHKGICPVCKKPLLIGAFHRVAVLSDRSEPAQPLRAPGFDYMIPLAEILSELEGTGVDSKKVNTAFIKAINFAGNELGLLNEMPLREIHVFNPLLGEAIRRMRSGEVRRIPGYDGVYGSIRLFDKKPELQTSMF
jgi:PHP family Zn ribbon phosphoesterase